MGLSIYMRYFFLGRMYARFQGFFTFSCLFFLLVLRTLSLNSSMTLGTSKRFCATSSLWGNGCLRGLSHPLKVMQLISSTETLLPLLCRVEHFISRRAILLDFDLLSFRACCSLYAAKWKWKRTILLHEIFLPFGERWRGPGAVDEAVPPTVGWLEGPQNCHVY